MAKIGYYFPEYFFSRTNEWNYLFGCEFQETIDMGHIIFRKLCDPQKSVQDICKYTGTA